MRSTTRLTPKLRQAVRWLRRHYPTSIPATVRLVRSMPDHHGMAVIGDGRAQIHITPDSDNVMVESLIEEWCHVLRHGCPVPIKDEHDSVFWAIFGLVSMAWRDS
jgi:hypothetical protein